MNPTTPAAMVLGGEFADVSRDQWLHEVRGVLTRGKPEASDEEVAAQFAKQLVTRTEDGFDLQPLYSAADAPPPQTPPGSAPFVRGTHAAPRDWEVRQRVWAGIDGSSAIEELENGATGVLLELPAGADVDLLDRLLADVHLDLAAVSLATPPADPGIDAARALLALWERRGIDPASRAGALGVDPIGAWARSGGATPADVAAAAELINELADTAPRARLLVADGTVWHDAGASAGQELAWTIAAAITAVRTLVDAGVDLTRAFAAIEFRWAATADQFETIAKLRAARGLWARVGELSGVDGAAMFQHADASRPMQTRYDPSVNMLRSTVACFAAAAGGADAITLSPHDSLLSEGGTSLGRRIARNTQSVLLLESNLARVVDIGGGSWYVESRTEALADAAWAITQDVERRGGLIAAVLDGGIHSALETTVSARAKAVATRRRPLTGLTEFPNVDETPPPQAPDDFAPRPGGFPPLTLRRWGDDVESIRGRVDATVRAGGQRPSLFLAALGGPAAATARATFAKNLFEVAGIRTIEGELDDFDPQVTPFACLCSSDRVYAAEAAAAAQALRAAGATRIYLAGRGLNIDGVDEEIGVGTDVVDVLDRTLDELGVRR